MPIDSFTPSDVNNHARPAVLAVSVIFIVVKFGGFATEMLPATPFKPFVALPMLSVSAPPLDVSASAAAIEATLIVSFPLPVVTERVEVSAAIQLSVLGNKPVSTPNEL